ncbi:kinesin-like nuclear fusion protein, partial [Teratosphaeriaceae sp. CCFEE 6253]
MGMAHSEELEEVKIRHEKEKTDLQRQVDDLKNAGESRATESATEVQDLRNTISHLQNQLESTNATVTSLRARVAAEDTRNAALEQERLALVSKTHFLEGNQEAQSHEFTTMRQQLQDAVGARETTLATLRREEVLRRKLNATILELRGNIRVFVRTRPLLAGEEEAAKVEYPDVDALDGGKEMVVHAPTTLSATGKERNEKHNYGFDRVFAPTTANEVVFEGCRDLIQSVVDGYNVSILSYGQTGSGKTYGMSGPDGIIPSAIALLLAEMQRLQEKGWAYAVEASFVEVYNETLNDLLGDAKTWDEGDDLTGSVRGKRREKHEIHHDALTGRTTVTNLSS